MKETETSFDTIKKWCVKPLRNLLLAVAMLLGSILALLQLPVVQQQLFSTIKNYIYTTTHYQIKCDALRLSWLRQITLEGLTLIDPENKPLFTIDRCKGRLNLFSLLLLKPNIIDSLSVSGGELHVEKNDQKDFNMAKFYAKVILPFLSEKDADLSINTIQLHGIHLHYHDQIAQQKISIENIQLGLSHLRSSTNHYSGYVTSFSYQETADIPLVCKNLMTQFKITPHSVLLKDCHLMTKYSNLQGDFTLKNRNQLSLFSDKKTMLLEAIVHDTTLSSIELGKFSKFFEGTDTLYKVDGSVSLTPHTIVWKNCKLVFGLCNSYMESTGCYNGVDADILVKAGMVYVHDLPKKLPLYLNRLEYIDITNARLVGNIAKSRLNGAFATNIGSIEPSLNLYHLGKATQDIAANVTLHNVTIDSIFPAIPIRSLSGKIAVKAKGTNLHSLNAAAKLTEIKTSHYKYQKIDISYMVANAIGTFKLNSQDPNAKLTLAGSYHMDVQKSLKVDGIMQEVHLQKLGLVGSPLTVSTAISLKVKNIFSKHPRGKATFKKCILQSLEKKVACDQIALEVIENEKKDVLTLTSPLIDCRLQGIFTINDLVHHINHLIVWLKKPVNLVELPATFHMDYFINCKNISPILNWFSSDLYISPATTFLGHFRYDKDYHIYLELPTASTFTFKRFNLENITLKLNASHILDVKKRLIDLSISSDKQDWNQIFQTDHLCFQLFMDKNKFTISNRLSNDARHLFIACSGTLKNHVIEVALLPSILTTKDRIWTIQTERSSFISKGAIEIGNLSITSGKESICIGGKLTELGATDPLHCTIRHLRVNYASAAGPIKGIINTKLLGHLEKGQMIVTGRLSVKDASIQEYAIGTLRTKVDWKLLENKLILEGVLQHGSQKLLEINGCYHLFKPSDNLAITTTFKEMHLDLLNPLFESVCSDINGKLSGQFQLTGTLSAPKINGEGKIDKGKFKINYLHTFYQATGTLQVRENRLYVQQLDLYDDASGHATLSGHLMIDNEWSLMLSGHMERFHMLHTTRIDNPDFYGELYATGSLQMEGSIKNLLVKIKATTDKGTFTIVTDDKENIKNTTKLVQFVYNKPKNKPKQPAQNDDSSIIKLLMDLKILPTVKVQVLFGGNNDMNDILQGQGTGVIQLEVGTNRKPYMMGNYLFQDGTYTVSVYNLIQKTFTIAPNSQINFNGYPQEGVAYIEASYRQLVSITELYPQSNDTRPIPVEISLSAYGRLAHPHIAYQLLFPVKSMDFELNTALEECASKAILDKNYLNKQILSLLIAKRVYNEKKIDGWGMVKNSINDFFAQRIQNLVSKINNNLEIETDLGINQLKDKEANLLQKTKIKVSYMLLSDDLKLSSTVGRYSRLINDWEIAYCISKTHNIHTKVYQQPLRNGSASLALFGISFAYTLRSFGSKPTYFS